AVADSTAPHVHVDASVARALALPAACAVEMIHSYSLVHDDLPAMDDDALRRGRPTSHVVFGEGLAILTGDALLTDAFGVLAAWPSIAAPPGSTEPPATRRLRALSVLAAAAGSSGMVGGQAIDLASTARASASGAGFDAPGLEDMHARKTGALIRAAATLGAIMTGADDVLVSAVDLYARELGLAFQIIDDVLDVEESAVALGKTAGKDAASGKPTFPALHGVAESRRRAAECIERAKASLQAAGLDGHLASLADWSLTRRS
ncbi:MAG: polyprenyl synthetase family protein, partial [Vicinamibacterales bacterium]